MQTMSVHLLLLVFVQAVASLVPLAASHLAHGSQRPVAADTYVSSGQTAQIVSARCDASSQVAIGNSRAEAWAFPECYVNWRAIVSPTSLPFQLSRQLKSGVRREIDTILFDTHKTRLGHHCVRTWCALISAISACPPRPRRSTVCTLCRPGYRHAWQTCPWCRACTAPHAGPGRRASRCAHCAGRRCSSRSGRHGRPTRCGSRRRWPGSRPGLFGSWARRISGLSNANVVPVMIGCVGASGRRG